MRKIVLSLLGLMVWSGLSASTAQASLIETVVKCTDVGGWGSSPAYEGSWGGGNGGGWGQSKLKELTAVVQRYPATGEYVLVVSFSEDFNKVVLAQEYVRFEPPSLGRAAKFTGANAVLEVDPARGEGFLSMGVAQVKKKLSCSR